ncbi:MAG: GntR family transcriptional regulator [Ruminococcaceae bacterium]|nr:GntR family transcriptional regulator [Oscillospiraceae bacterium]
MIRPDYKSGKSLHEQIEDEMKRLIISGAMRPDEQLPSVRELSVSMTVNPNTVQRAYKQLEQDGFIYSIKGKGNFVSTLSKTESVKRSEELRETISEAVRELAFLGEDKDAVKELIDQIYREKEENK